jgi:hypothetical protein
MDVARTNEIEQSNVYINTCFDALPSFGKISKKADISNIAPKIDKITYFAVMGKKYVAVDAAINAIQAVNNGLW